MTTWLTDEQITHFREDDVVHLQVAIPQTINCFQRSGALGLFGVRCQSSFGFPVDQD
jgi:hypothetical protein